MDKATAISDAQKYAKLVTAEINPAKIILFGSYAASRFHEQSDIDVAVVMDDLDSEFLNISIRLNRLTSKVNNRIEPILLSSKNDPSGFLQTIMKQGILLYERKNNS